MNSSEPPVAKQVPHQWTRPTGVVDDPWAWMADRDDPDTIPYLQAENDFTETWLDGHRDLVDAIYHEIRSRVREDDISAPVRHGDWWYSTRTLENAAYPIHCRGRSAEDATQFVLIDQNLEAQGQDHFDLGAFDISVDQRFLAWSSDLDGSERYTLRIRDLEPGADAGPVDLEDRIEGTSWGGTAWSSDGEWLFYVMPDEAMRPYEVRRHRIGTDAHQDEVVFTETDERFFVHVERTRNDAWIVITSGSHTSSDVRVLPASDPTAPCRLVRERRENIEYGLEDLGDRFVIVTNDEAVDFRVMTAAHDSPEVWQEWIPHEPGRRITGVEPFAHHVVVHEWSRAQQQIRVLHRDGSETAVSVLEGPHELELDANPDWNATAVRVRVQSLVQPPTVIDVDPVSGIGTEIKRLDTPNVDLERYCTRRVWATAPDGTEVPLDLVHLADASHDNTAPGVLYGYGAYEASMPPWFSVARLSLVDRGFVWALAHPRGGGELGRRWYLEGKLAAKSNTFTDTLACANHLVVIGAVNANRLAVRGGSAGGLLVGACVTLDPERFAAAVAEVPFVDVVTTMSDPSLPLTVTEWEEWGDPRTEPWTSIISAYSPYDLTDATLTGRLPSMYVTAGLNDPRVAYHEPAKWVAKIRALKASRPGATVLLRTELGAGHGGPTGRYDRWRDEARILAFVIEECRQR